MRPTDTRKLAREGERRLAGWVIFFLVVVGTAAIALVYGPGAALTGVLCLLAGAGLFALLYGLLVWMERWANQDG